MRLPAASRSALLALVAAAVAAAPATAVAQERLRPKRFASCGELVRYARLHALRTDARGGGIVPPFAPMPVAERDDGAEAPAAGGTGFSGTNVQEAGVDEPDVVKTNGELVFALAGGALHAVDVRGAEPRRLGTLELGNDGAHELLLHEGRALVISRAYTLATDTPVQPAPRPGVAPAVDIGMPMTVIREVDVSDPAAMRVLRTVRTEASYASARLTGATARIVLTSAPSPAAMTRAAIRASRPSTWLPDGVVRNRRTGRRSERRLVPCAAVRRPRAFSGLGLTTVLTVDMERGLPWVDADAIMSDAQVVYGSPGSLYVATQRWLDPRTEPGGSVTTQIHRFAAAAADSTTYRASGEVPGHLLNQFSLSEHDGRLRVASTETPVWLGGEQRRESESRVTVLAESGDRLRPVGSVGGLGRGERIYSVRFIGDAGYVVTFREIDPLYTVDLSDPTAPRVAGELKIPGYSAYLHPLGDGLLLGVGQDATDEGRTTGTQVSVFDVSDPARPVRLHRHTVARGAYSEAEYDHHAFLYWAPAGLAVLPVEAYGEKGRDGFVGAAAYRLGPGGTIAEAGRLEHPAEPGEMPSPVRRSLVVGDRLYTLSDAGLLASGLGDLARVAWLRLAAPAREG